MAHSSQFAQSAILNWAYTQLEEEISEAMQALGIVQSDMHPVNMLTMVEWIMGDYSAADFVP